MAQPVTAAGLGGPRGAAPLSDGGKAAGEQLGTVLGFAAEPGHAALDGSPGQNSPYVPGVCSKGRACPECTQAAAVKASPLSHTLQDILYKIERRVVGPVHVLEENTVVHLQHLAEAHLTVQEKSLGRSDRAVLPNPRVKWDGA